MTAGAESGDGLVKGDEQFNDVVTLAKRVGAIFPHANPAERMKRLLNFTGKPTGFIFRVFDGGSASPAMH